MPSEAVEQDENAGRVKDAAQLGELGRGWNDVQEDAENDGEDGNERDHSAS